MKTWKAVVILIGALGGLTLQAAEPPRPSRTYELNGQKIELARYAKALLGPGNVQIQLTRFKDSRGKEGAILLFQGVESDWDGQAILHSVRPAAYNGTQYYTTYKGKDWNSLTSRRSPDGTEKWELWVPGAGEGIAVIPSDGAAQLITPAEILQKYLDQQRKP